MQTSWLCPTALDRERVLETCARIRRPRLLGLCFVTVACAVASPWLGWPPIGLALAAIGVGAVAIHRALVSRRPEYVVLAMIAINAAAIAVGAAWSGGAQSPVLVLNALVVTESAAYFRQRGVTVASGLAIA